MSLRQIDYEEEARFLLDEYIEKTGEALAPPVPIEQIIEIVSRFDVLYDNDELSSNESGRIDFANKLITIRHDEIEGRQRFSLAHEAGHLRLHAHKINLETTNIPGLFGDTSGPHLSRRGSSAWHEVEANRFAAAALMPLPLLRIVLEKAKPKFQYLLDRPDKMRSTVGSYLAAEFQVSAQAMGIRLKEIGLMPELFTDRLF